MAVRSPRASDTARLVQLWLAERSRPESCWSVADGINPSHLASLSAKFNGRVSERANQASGLSLTWANEGDYLRISVLAETDDDFDDLLEDRLLEAQSLGLLGIYGHVPETATETIARLNRWTVEWTNRGGFYPGPPRVPANVYPVMTVAVTLPELLAR